MLLHAFLLLCTGACWALACDLRHDLSPFLWQNEKNVCTKEICQSYPYLKCDIAREYIMDQAIGHMEDDILYEIEVMQEYFNTFIPRPTNTLDYECKGICQNGMKQLQLQRIFTTVIVREQNPLTNMTQIVPKHMMCVVIGPNIYYQQCGGKCDLLNNNNYYCVPDVTVKIKLWVFCPDVEPGCHKVDFDVPLSCTCKKITCRKDIVFPANVPFSPNVPVFPSMGTALGGANLMTPVI